MNNVLINNSTQVGFVSIVEKQAFLLLKFLKKCNDPSAGSPTDTLLRLLLPLITVI